MNPDADRSLTTEPCHFDTAFPDIVVTDIYNILRETANVNDESFLEEKVTRAWVSHPMFLYILTSLTLYVNLVQVDVFEKYTPSPGFVLHTCHMEDEAGARSVLFEDINLYEIHIYSERS